MNAGLTLCFTLLSAFLLFCMSFIVTVTGNGNGTVTIPNVNISASSASAVGIRNPFLPACLGLPACCSWANKQKTYMTYAPTPNCNYGGLPGSGPGLGVGPGPQLQHHPSSTATSVLMAPPSQGNIYTSMGHPAVSGAMTIGKHCARLLNYLLKPLPIARLPLHVCSLSVTLTQFKR